MSSSLYLFKRQFMTLGISARRFKLQTYCGNIYALTQVKCLPWEGDDDL